MQVIKEQLRAKLTFKSHRHVLVDVIEAEYHIDEIYRCDDFLHAALRSLYCNFLRIFKHSLSRPMPVTYSTRWSVLFFIDSTSIVKNPELRSDAILYLYTHQA